jgi:hypothetical protein
MKQTATKIGLALARVALVAVTGLLFGTFVVGGIIWLASTASG